jgi:hypothetical protein
LCVQTLFLTLVTSIVALVSARLSRTAFFVEEAFGSSDRTRLQSQTCGAG